MRMLRERDMHAETPPTRAQTLPLTLKKHSRNSQPRLCMCTSQCTAVSAPNQCHTLILIALKHTGFRSHDTSTHVTAESPRIS